MYPKFDVKSYCQPDLLNGIELCGSKYGCAEVHIQTTKMKYISATVNTYYCMVKPCIQWDVKKSLVFIDARQDEYKTRLVLICLLLGSVCKDDLFSTISLPFSAQANCFTIAERCSLRSTKVISNTEIVNVPQSLEAQGSHSTVLLASVSEIYWFLVQLSYSMYYWRTREKVEETTIVVCWPRYHQ